MQIDHQVGVDLQELGQDLIRHLRCQDLQPGGGPRCLAHKEIPAVPEGETGRRNKVLSGQSGMDQVII